MLTVYLRITDDRLEIGRGEMRAQFERQPGQPWTPAWMWQADRRMLRFKNHEWLSVGPARPKAIDWEILEDSAERVRVRFLGNDACLGVPFKWAVTVGVESAQPGFTITTDFVPSETIELFECFSRFETPREYNGQEEALCVIGQNPVAKWRGDQLFTPGSAHRIPGMNGRWIARSITPTRAPICCLRVVDPRDKRARHVSVLGHWRDCCFRHIAVQPSSQDDGYRSYELLAGVLDWRCSDQPEPNVFFKAGFRYRQKLTLNFASDMPGGTIDRWLFGAFERSVRLFFPANATLEIESGLAERGVSLAEANARLIEALGGQTVPGMFDPANGMVTYTEGSAPDSGEISLRALAPWLAALGYQSYITRREDLHALCERLIGPVSEAVDHPIPSQWSVGPIFHELLPLLRYLSCYPGDSLHGTVRRALGRMLEAYPPEGGDRPDLDYGSEALNAEAYLLAARLAGDKRLLAGGFASLAQVNAAGAERFWRFGCSGGWEDSRAGGQARPIGYGHAIMANLLAYERTHNEEYMEMAGVFARYLVSICFGTFNDSNDPDFDTRGFADGALAGADRRIECSPLESSDSLRCLAYYLSFRPDMPAGYYDLLWLFSRTFSGVFPAARRIRTGWTVNGEPVSLPSDAIDHRFPYIACENPLRQTRQSPRASVEACLNYLMFGDGLASCADSRLLVLAPRVGGYDLGERTGRLIHIYNPTELPLKTAVTAHALPAWREFEIIVRNQRVATHVAGDKVRDIEIEIPARRAVIMDVVLTRQPSTHF